MIFSFHCKKIKIKIKIGQDITTPSLIIVDP